MESGGRAGLRGWRNEGDENGWKGFLVRMDGFDRMDRPSGFARGGGRPKPKLHPFRWLSPDRITRAVPRRGLGVTGACLALGPPSAKFFDDSHAYCSSTVPEWPGEGAN